MQTPNDRPTDGTSRKGHPAPSSAKTPTPTTKRPASTPPSTLPATPEVKDVLKTQMPTGEVGVRNQPGATLASASGGTSKAEDTSRAAGYVADLTKPNAAPPGPPIEKTAENFAGQSGNTPAPGKRPEKATPNTTPPTPPSPPTPDPTTPVPDRPPTDVPPGTDRPVRLPAPKGTVKPPKPDAAGRIARAKDQAGKIGMAILMWMLGVPGGIVLLYLIFR